MPSSRTRSGPSGMTIIRQVVKREAEEAMETADVGETVVIEETVKEETVATTATLQTDGQQIYIIQVRVEIQSQYDGIPQIYHLILYLKSRLRTELSLWRAPRWLWLTIWPFTRRFRRWSNCPEDRWLRQPPTGSN